MFIQKQKIDQEIQTIPGLIESQTKDIIKEAKATIKALNKNKGKPLPNASSGKESKTKEKESKKSKKQDSKSQAPVIDWQQMCKQLHVNINQVNDGVPQWRHGTLISNSIAEAYVLCAYCVETVTKYQADAHNTVFTMTNENLQTAQADVDAQLAPELEELKTKFPESTVECQTEEENILNQVFTKVNIPSSIALITQSIFANFHSFVVPFLIEMKSLKEQTKTENLVWLIV